MHRERILLLLLLLGTAALGLAGRLFQLQIVEGETWRAEAETLGSRSRTIPFRRGAILDRRGRPIAVDEESYGIDLELGAYRGRDPLAQAASALSVLEGRPVPFAEVAADPVGSARALVGVTPARIAEVFLDFERQRLRTALQRLLGLGRSDRRRLFASIRDGSAAPLATAFPEACAAVESRIRESAGHLALLDRSLGREPGTCIALLDDLRARVAADVERRVSRRVSQAAQRGEELDVAGERNQIRRQRETWLERFADDAPYASAEILAARPEWFPGFSAVETMTRRYPSPVLPALVGAVASPSAEDLDRTLQDEQRMRELARQLVLSEEEERELDELRQRVRAESYVAGDVRGVSGLEWAWEESLRGSRGWRIETPSLHAGEPVRTVWRAPEHGRDLRLTIDLELQELAESLLRRGFPAHPEIVVRGAIALFEVATGDVLALAATPDVHREDLFDPVRRAAVMRIQEDGPSRAKPMNHRGYRPYFPPTPGSVFKLVTSVAALERGLVDPETKHFCGGRIGTLRCEGQHGDIGLVPALELSCNCYFGWLAERLGRDGLQAEAERFGFGSPTGFSRAEFAGRFELQDRNVEMLRRFGIGYTLTVTPLQVARMASVFATGGRLPALRVVRAVGEDDLLPEPAADLRISARTIEVVREAMRGVVTRGTAKGLGLSEVRVAGKTGTSEVDRHGIDNHAWFAGFAPAEAPRIAFALFAEKVPVHGSVVAAMAARLLASDAMAPWLRTP